MRISLPDEVEFVCPGCTGKFRLKAQLLHNRLELSCPLCSTAFPVYDGLPSNLKRKAYHAMRDEIERIMYSKYRDFHSESADEWDVSSESNFQPKD